MSQSVSQCEVVVSSWLVVDMEMPPLIEKIYEEAESLTTQ